MLALSSIVKEKNTSVKMKEKILVTLLSTSVSATIEVNPLNMLYIAITKKLKESKKKTILLRDNLVILLSFDYAELLAD